MITACISLEKKGKVPQLQDQDYLPIKKNNGEALVSTVYWVQPIPRLNFEAAHWWRP